MILLGPDGVNNELLKDHVIKGPDAEGLQIYFAGMYDGMVEDWIITYLEYLYLLSLISMDPVVSNTRCNTSQKNV